MRQSMVNSFFTSKGELDSFCLPIDIRGYSGFPFHQFIIIQMFFILTITKLYIKYNQ